MLFHFPSLLVTYIVTQIVFALSLTHFMQPNRLSLRFEVFRPLGFITGLPEVWG
jgi:hypothetical protein